MEGKVWRGEMVEEFREGGGVMEEEGGGLRKVVLMGMGERLGK